MAQPVSNALINSSVKMKLAIVGLAVSLILHIIGFSTKHWMYSHQQTLYITTETSSGLWGACVCVVHIWLSSTNMEACACASAGLSTTSWLTPVQVLETLGLVALVVSVLLLLLHVAGTGVGTDAGRKINDAGRALAIIAGISILAGVVVYGAWNSGNSRYLHYSFGLCTVAAAGSFVSSALLVSDAQSRGAPNTGGTRYTGGGVPGVVLSPPPGQGVPPPAYGHAVAGRPYHITVT